MRIWKWSLDITDAQTLTMPIGAKVLTAQIQWRSGLQLWALIDDAICQQKEARTFAVYGTGNPIPDDPGEYIATVQKKLRDMEKRLLVQSVRSSYIRQLCWQQTPF